MANGKKSFLFYCDWIDTFKSLSKEDGYDLLIHLLGYVNDENPVSDNPIINGIFPIIKNQLKRDLNKYEIIRGKRSDAGKASAEKRKQKQQVLTSVDKREQTSTNPTVIDIDNVNVIVNDIIKRKAEFKNSLKSFKDTYGLLMLEEFFGYWSEHNEKGKKMRFEYSKNQPFNLKRRLITWSKKSKDQNISNNGQEKKISKSVADRMKQF